MDSYKKFAAVYDQLINEDIDYKSWAEKIIHICNENNVSRDYYLDLACGTGNITELIAPQFKETWAVDLSEEMLIEADKKLRDKKIKARLVRQNMIDLNLNKKFDLITCCLDSINYLIDREEVRQCFSAVKQHLKEDGIFIFDLNSEYKLIEVLGNNTFTFTGEDVAYIWQNYCEEDIIEMYITFFLKSVNSNVYERFEEEHCERAYDEEIIDNLLRDCGLKVKNKMDNYSSDKISSNTERIVYIVKNI